MACTFKNRLRKKSLLISSLHGSIVIALCCTCVWRAEYMCVLSEANQHAHLFLLHCFSCQRCARSVKFWEQKNTIRPLTHQFTQSQMHSFLSVVRTFSHTSQAETCDPCSTLQETNWENKGWEKREGDVADKSEENEQFEGNNGIIMKWKQWQGKLTAYVKGKALKTCEETRQKTGGWVRERGKTLTWWLPLTFHEAAFTSCPSCFCLCECYWPRVSSNLSTERLRERERKGGWKGGKGVEVLAEVVLGGWRKEERRNNMLQH